MSEQAALVALTGIVKRFGALYANDRIDFDLRAGEIHALLGENGAGKSTLMNILAGQHRPDEGEIAVRGRVVRFRSPKDAIEAGVGMVHQHFRLVERFTVAENMTLGWHTPRALIRVRPLAAEIARQSRAYGLDVDPYRPIWQLSVGEQQRVEILKNLYRGARVLVLDEPTAVLTPQESEALFATLRQITSDGRGVVFISHKLDEVMAIADRITVLRRGRKIATVQKASTSTRELARMMVGQDLPRLERRPSDCRGRTLLHVAGLEVDDDRGLPAVRGVELEIAAGEILGLAGVAGNGQVQLAEAIVGLRPARSGRVELAGRDITSWPLRRRIQAGIAYTPEDRYRDGLVALRSVTDNLVGKAYRSPPVGGRMLFRPRGARRLATQLATRFDIRGAALGDPAVSLSGGNAQKLVLARELSAGPSLLVAAQPTRGLDVGAAEAARRLLAGLAEAGKAVLLISEDLDELIEMCDRVAVIHRGRLTGTLAAGDADEEHIGLLMAGVVE
jgi:general nucleoside transport system ATP-binding protein